MAAETGRLRLRRSLSLSRIRIRGATIVSMDPSIGIIDDGDLLIDEGKIIAIGESSAAGR